MLGPWISIINIRKQTNNKQTNNEQTNNKKQTNKQQTSKNKQTNKEQMITCAPPWARASPRLLLDSFFLQSSHFESIDHSFSWIQIQQWHPVQIIPILRISSQEDKVSPELGTFPQQLFSMETSLCLQRKKSWKHIQIWWLWCNSGDDDDDDGDDDGESLKMTGSANSDRWDKK